MKNIAKAALLSSALTLSMGAFAQAPSPMATTPDGKTPAQDSTMATPHDATKHQKSHSTTRKSTTGSSSTTQSKPAPDVINQTTPDGKNKIPDATPVTK